MLELISRAEARALGLKYYFTGKPCPKGHVADRRVSNPECVDCRKERARAYARRYAEANRTRARTWRNLNLEKARARENAYYLANREIVLIRRKSHKKKEVDYWNLYGRKSRALNPERHKLSEGKRRARKSGSPAAQITGTQIEELARKQKYRCALCAKKLSGKYHCDHIVPLSLGGSHEITNIQLTHPRCNLSKGGKDPIAWAQDNGRLL